MINKIISSTKKTKSATPLIAQQTLLSDILDFIIRRPLQKVLLPVCSEHLWEQARMTRMT